MYVLPVAASMAPKTLEVPRLPLFKLALTSTYPNRARIGGVLTSSTTNDCSMKLTSHARDYLAIRISELLGLGVDAGSSQLERQAVIRDNVSIWWDKYFVPYPSSVGRGSFALSPLLPRDHTRERGSLNVAWMKRDTKGFTQVCCCVLCTVDCVPLHFSICVDAAFAACCELPHRRGELRAYPWIDNAISC